MPQFDDLSPISNSNLRSLAITYFPKHRVSRMNRTELVPFFLSAMAEEEASLFSAKLRRGNGSATDIDAVRPGVQRKMWERYGNELYSRYLASEVRQSNEQLRPYICSSSSSSNSSIRPTSSSTLVPTSATSPTPLSGALEPEASPVADGSHPDESWPQLVSQERKLACYSAFVEGTKIQEGPTCATCSRRTFTQDLLFTQSHLSTQRVPAQSLPLDLLKIDDPHVLARPGGWFEFDDASLNGMALDKAGLHASPVGTEADVCGDCLADFHKQPPRLPPLSLANGNIRGFLPPNLRDCTWIEERLCARFLGSAFVVRMYDVTHHKNKNAPEYDTRPRIMRGHTCAFPLNVIATAQSLPWSLDTLGPLVSCIVIGPRKPRPSDLRNVFKVRRAKVMQLLLFLRDNFKDYPQFNIDWEALQQLPEDGVPDIFMRQVIHESVEDGTELFDAETAGLEAHPALLEVDDAAVGEGMTYVEHHGVIDVNGVGVSADSRIASALTKATGGERPDLIIKHGSAFVSEYNNPELFPGMFPLLFPWGTGGFEARRRTPLSFNRQATYLLDLADPAFRRHWFYVFAVANIKQRRTIHVGSRIACRSRDYARASRLLSDLKGETVQRVAEHLSLGGNTSTLSQDEKRVLTLLKKCELLSVQVPGSKAVMNRARADIRSIIGEFGIFQIFLTINPHPEFAPVFQVFYGGVEIDLDVPAPLKTALSQRLSQVADDPIAAADFFHFQIAATFQYLFGWDVRARRSTEEGGILGRLAAFFMVREHTMRGQLHGHILVWLDGGLNPRPLRQKLASDDEFRKRYLAFLDDIIWHHVPAEEGQQGRSPPPSGVTPEDSKGMAQTPGAALESDHALGFQQVTSPDPIRTTSESRQQCAASTSADPPAVPAVGDDDDDDHFGAGLPPTGPGTNPREMMPPDHNHPNFLRHFERDHRLLGEVLQRHKHRKTCYKHGRKVCRFGYPHDLNPETTFDPETKSVQLRILDAWLNWHNAWMLLLLRCNMDLKWVQSGLSGVAAAAYMTGYACKSDETPANQVSMIKTVYQRLDQQHEAHPELHKLLSLCVMQFGRARQLHAQQVATYVRDLGDVWSSHTTVPMLSGSMLSKVFRLYGAPLVKATPQSDSEPCAAVATGTGADAGRDRAEAPAGYEDSTGGQDDRIAQYRAHDQDDVSGEDGADGEILQGNDDGDDDELCTLQTSGLAHQVIDYLYRGVTLQDLNFYDFVKFCRLAPMPKKKRVTAHHTLDPAHPNFKTHVHRYTPDRPHGIPRAIYTSLPRSDGSGTHGDRYCAAMLCHFVPFSISRPLKPADSTYEEHYASSEFPPFAQRIIDNWQALVECDDAKDRDQLLRRKREAARASGHDTTASYVADGPEADDPDADVHASSLAASTMRLNAETVTLLNGLSRSGWFSSHRPHSTNIASVDINEECPVFSNSRRRQWAKEQERIEGDQRERLAVPRASCGVLAEDLSLDQDIAPNTTAAADEDVMSEHDTVAEPTVERRIWDSKPPHTLIEELVQERGLNDSQALAFRIVARHFFQEHFGAEQAPLRMLMHGAAGTGKTVVVRLLRELLDRYGKGKEIIFMAPTGKAACAIGGVTQHSAFSLTIDRRRKGVSNEDLVHEPETASARRIKYLQDKFSGIRWIFFDEVSMTSCEIMSQIDQSLRIGTQKPDEPFGGVNVVFAGDLCQLPPVASAPLYTSTSSTKQSAEARTKVEMGRAAWLQIQTVVDFTQQMRMKDTAMAAALARMRIRQCSPDDAHLFNSNVLPHKLAPQSEAPPHADAIVLARTNEAVRVLNTRKAQTQAEAHSSALMISHALDTSTSPIDTEHRRTLLAYNGTSMDRGAWGRVPLFLGMPVVYRGPNTSVILGVTNGATATVVGWDLIRDEHGLTVPRGIVLRFSDEAAWSLTGLQSGCLPIDPIATKFKFTSQIPDQPPFQVSRKQIPVRPAFAITIHSAQGITNKIGIIVDLREGGFEAYVAASRATKREHVFLVAPVTTACLNHPPLPVTLDAELKRLAALASSTNAQHNHDKWRLHGFLKRRAPPPPSTVQVTSEGPQDAQDDVRASKRARLMPVL